MPKISDKKWNLNKKKIIDTAFELFSTHGYSQVSVNDIVKKADISKGGFYTYFKGKQDIFIEILNLSDNEKMYLESQTTNCKSAAEKLKIYITCRLNNFMCEENRKWVKFAIEFWATVKRDREIDNKNSERFEGYTNGIKSIIEDGIQSGEFKASIDKESVVYLLISMIDGMGLISSVMEQQFDEKKIEMVVDVFTNYLKV
ncbi:TetR/AcrR family transcriptional regulator [Clostridium thailandense]|uniref:TetR/AcrR family transcriptional regulator n=1 Tax=Clostridium thailandense TaxID=2794346 RepID=UPI003989C876